MIDNLELLADAIVELASTKGQAIGARSWADMVPRDHPDYLASQQRAHDADEAAGLALWAVAFELYGHGRSTAANHLAEEVNAFADRMNQAWHKGYLAGFEDHPWDTSDTVPFDDDDALPAVQVVEVNGHLDVAVVEPVDVRGDLL